MTSLRSLVAQLLVSVMLCSVAAPAFGAVQRQPRAKSVATSITFDKSDAKVEPKKTVEVTATVRDQFGKAMDDARVSWLNTAQPEGSSLAFSRSPEEAKANTLIITGKAGDPAIRQRISTVVTAVSGDASQDLQITYESTPKPPPAKIIFNPATVDLDADGEATIKASVADADDKAIHGSEVTWALAKPELNDFVRLGTVVNDDKTNSIIVLGRTPKDKDKKTPDVVTLIASVGNRPLGFVTINYKAAKQGEGVETTWSVLPPKIVADNFGKTIASDYYCIEVAIDNHSDSDIALGSLKFILAGTIRPIPTSYFPILQGSLARRKITHPRAIVLAAIDSIGSLMTGFNPFFHNINHAKNYSQAIDIISNPLAKGVAAVWQDPYPIEMANFSASVLKDDKIIAKNAPTFKTVVFIEKRNLYPNKGGDSKDRNDPIAVRNKLSELVVRFNPISQGKTQERSSPK